MAARTQTKDFLDPFDLLPDPFITDPGAYSPPIFGGDGGAGVDVGADPSGGTGVPSGTMPGGTSGNLAGGGSAASTVARLLGGGGAAGGGMGLNDILPWLSVLGPLLGGIMGYRAQGQASQQMQNAMRDANSQITSLLGPGGAQGAYAPYTAAGNAALAKLGAMPTSNIAGQFGGLAGSFGPLGSGRGVVGPQGRSFASIMGGR